MLCLSVAGGLHTDGRCSFRECVCVVHARSLTEKLLRPSESRAVIWTGSWQRIINPKKSYFGQCRKSRGRNLRQKARWLHWLWGARTSWVQSSDQPLCRDGWRSAESQRRFNVSAVLRMLQGQTRMSAGSHRPAGCQTVLRDAADWSTGKNTLQFQLVLWSSLFWR